MGFCSEKKTFSNFLLLLLLCVEGPEREMKKKKKVKRTLIREMIKMETYLWSDEEGEKKYGSIQVEAFL